MPNFKIGEIYTTSNGGEITIVKTTSTMGYFTRLKTDGTIYNGHLTFDEIDKKISNGSWVLKGSSTVPVKMSKSTQKTNKTQTSTKAINKKFKKGDKVEILTTRGRYGHSFNKGDIGEVYSVDKRGVNVIVGKKSQLLPFDEVELIASSTSSSTSSSTLPAYFEKDDYIVTIYSQVSGGNRDFPDNYIFKQREKANYLSVDLDATGDRNGWVIFKADKTGKGEWRYATQEEAEAYEKAGKPISVDDVSKILNQSSAKPKAIKTFDAQEIVEDLKDMNIQVWDDIGITSGGELYQNDDFQKKYNDLMVAAIESYTKYDLSKLSQKEWESVSEILEEDNFHSLNNFLALKDYLGQKVKDSWIDFYSRSPKSCLKPDIFIDKTIVATKEEIVEKAPIKKMATSNEEAQIEILKRDIAQLLFIRSLASPIEFERKMQISQIIEEKKKEIDRLTFYMTERKIGGKEIFDDLFEQSFTPIQHAYSNVYGSPDTTDFFTPDGKPSELSDELNIIIRTKEFKEWFGDWELAYLYRDTEIIDCSKVLNENFEPRLVWHGTGAEFSSFIFDSFPAAYFAVNKAYADWFAYAQGGDDGFTIPFFLNIRNPLDLKHFGTNKIKPKQFFDYLYLKTGLDMDALEVNPMFLQPTFPEVETWVYLRNNPKMIVKIAESKIYDGINFFETNPGVEEGKAEYKTEVYITFSAEQSKIAAPNRGMLLLASLKSFLLKRGGQI